MIILLAQQATAPSTTRPLGYDSKPGLWSVQLRAFFAVDQGSGGGYGFIGARFRFAWWVEGKLIWWKGKMMMYWSLVIFQENEGKQAGVV